MYRRYSINAFSFSTPQSTWSNSLGGNLPGEESDFGQRSLGPCIPGEVLLRVDLSIPGLDIKKKKDR